MRISARETEVIAPHFKQRLSGVTSTIIQLIPLQVSLGVRIATLGPGLPETLPWLAWSSLSGFWKRPANRPFRIWHARRNIEMLAGIILRDILRMKLRLIFTSASQRHHKRFTKWLIRRMDRVIATSKRTGSYLEVPYQVIMHGIDTERFSPPADKQAELAAANLPGKYAVGCFGRVRHQKGTDLFVDSMIALLPHYPDWVALVAGRATAEHQAFEQELKDKVAAAGLEKRIIFLGESRDIPRWYKALSLYVAPSRREGFGLTPLEAMAAQSAVVTSDAGAYTELVAEGTGTVVPAGDPAAMQQAIEYYFAHPQETIKAGKTALHHVRTNFPLLKEAQAIDALYEDLFTKGA
ncbi:MAG: Glycosyl transferases group 1 protein [Candidatus Tokpelaia hoelldobleri]|uniref:Glycosyl transferases group 1 protein n=1 Tax=Candidatus Tokpelaia hoelldobleri TaxID=1902579 RepID=A0A1U9JUW7_9HYPH|nr:MAG: Glycosyl transferases group 1 protein [Candidatus Tokpelaia hoelldoblerii]